VPITVARAGGPRVERSCAAWASAVQSEHRPLLQGATATERGARRTTGACDWNAAAGGTTRAMVVARSQCQARRWNEHFDAGHPKQPECLSAATRAEARAGLPDSPFGRHRFSVLRRRAGLGYRPVRGEDGETAMLWGLMDKLCRGDVVNANRYFAGYFGIARL